MDAKINAIAIHFTRVAMAPCFCHSEIGGPNFSWFISQACSFFDPFEKQKAASSKNGTVGNSGKNAPITPRAKEIHPNAIQIYRTYCFPLFATLHHSFCEPFLRYHIWGILPKCEQGKIKKARNSL